MAYLEEIKDTDFSDSRAQQPFGCTVDTRRYEETCTKWVTKTPHMMLRLHTSIGSTVDADFTSRSILVFNQVLTVQNSQCTNATLTRLYLRRSDKIIKALVLHISSQYPLGCRTCSKTWPRTFVSLVPAKCQFSPNSLPPRILGTARIAPYFCMNVMVDELQYGEIAIEKPPYPRQTSGVRARTRCYTVLAQRTILESWRRSIELGVFMPNDEHRHLRAVLTLEPHLHDRSVTQQRRLHTLSHRPASPRSR